VVVWIRDRAEAPAAPARLGIVVSRRHGPAVWRNLFKRRVRESFRRNKPLWGRGLDLVVMPKVQGARFAPSAKDLLADLCRLVKPLGGDGRET
jgi:ribonuclease P protein component